MSVLFNNEHNLEQKEYKNRPNVRRVGEKDKRSREDNLLVFGYACNIFCDEEKAVFFDEGRHLIPWMGDESLMIDRYDGRLLLDDLSLFIPKSSSVGSQLPEEELELERQCDKERYLALEENISDTEYEEEDEMKRFKEAIASDDSYSAVGFSYDQYYPTYKYGSAQDISMSAALYQPYTQQESGEPVAPGPEEPSSSQSHQPEELEVFVPPEELGVPEGMEVPDTAKLHAIIERTAFFIKDHGPQMEIVVKAKQSGNQQFDFLHFDHSLNPYYKLILKAVRNGTYEPVTTKAPSPCSPTPEEEDESEESDGELELHPLLTASLRRPIVPTAKRTPPVTKSEQPLPPGWTVVTTEANSWESSHSSEITTDMSFPGLDGMNMAMPFQVGHTIHGHSHTNYVPPPPPPPGESPPRTDDHETQQSFDSAVLPPGPPVVCYPDNFLGPGLSFTDPNMANYAVNVGPPIIPPPPDLKPICDKLAEYVARNGQQFEDNIKVKGDPRFDFLHETSDHYTYYLMKRKEFEQSPPESSTVADLARSSKNTPLAPNSKPVSFQIKAKDTKKPVIEYRSSVIFKTAKADESDEEEADEEQSKENNSNENAKGSSQNGKATESQPDVHGPKTEEDVMAEERTTKLKEEKEKEVQRLEEEAKSTTSSLRRQVQLERRRRAQLFINMLKKTKPASEQSSSNQNSSDTNNIFEPQASS